MTNLAWPPLETGSGRFARWIRIAWVSFAVLVLMALSFTLGRATIGHAGPMKPVVDQTVLQPADPAAGQGELGCRQHSQC